jgi:hypothetical protein
MIRQAASRSACPVCPAADPDAELRNRINLHVARHNEAGDLYSRLANEYNDLRHEAGSVLEALQDAVESSGEELGTRVAWLMEQRLLIIESNEQLQEKIQELKYGLKSLPDVNHNLVETLRALEKTSMLLGEHVDVLQQGVVNLCMEFKTMFTIKFNEASPEEPVVESPVQSPAASQVEAHEEPVINPLVNWDIRSQPNPGECI